MVRSYWRRRRFVPHNPDHPRLSQSLISNPKRKLSKHSFNNNAQKLKISKRRQIIIPPATSSNDMTNLLHSLTVEFLLPLTPTRPSTGYQVVLQPLHNARR